MSSMVRNLLPRPVAFLAVAAASVGALATISLATPSLAQISGDVRGNMVARQPGEIGAAINRWERLHANGEYEFADYAGFVLAYPDFPRTNVLQIKAEQTLDDAVPRQEDVLAFFDANPPRTNHARALYALTLAAVRRPEASEMAREAWRGGDMSEPAEAYILSLFGSDLSDDDHRARMDALLWQENASGAERHMINLPASDRPLALSRLALVRGNLPADAGFDAPADAMSNAGYVYNLVNYYRAKNQTQSAIAALANRPQFTAPAHDAEAMVGDMLTTSKSASATRAVQIASKIDDLFAPDADISKGSFRLRDRYTDLMWLGGTKAFWELRNGNAAAPLFLRYGKAAQSPLTRAKGFYWAGRAARQAGQEQDAVRYFEMAAQYPHQYYGQLSLGALGRSMPEFAAIPRANVNDAARAEFEARPLVRAIRNIAANRRDWRTERRFFQAIGDAASDPQDLLMVNQLAAQTGLKEMAVVVGMEADSNGLSGFERIGYPTVPTPVVNDWTMVHAIARQESEFDRTRKSHANAIGMMQLLRSTAREEAGILGIQYLSASLTEDPLYNITLGDAHYSRRMDLYGGAYPLAIASYNAGPGRVRQWLQLNGDPRKGEIEWEEWIEKIPANFETRYYVMRVIGNAVAYSHMYPEQAGLPRTVDTFLP